MITGSVSYVGKESVVHVLWQCPVYDEKVLYQKVQ